MGRTSISRERETAHATYPADLQTVGDHTSLTVAAGGDWIEKPNYSTHIKMQALTQNIRYRVDDGTATATVGFQLVAGADTLAPVPNRGISIAREAGGAVLQYQFVR